MAGSAPLGFNSVAIDVMFQTTMNRVKKLMATEAIKINFTATSGVFYCLALLGDNSAAKTPRMGDSDSVHFSDGEFIEG